MVSIAPVEVKVDTRGLFEKCQCREIIDIVKDAVCFNQGEYAQFSYLAAEKHKTLKQLLLSREHDGEAKTADLKAAYDSFSRYLAVQMKSIFDGNFHCLQKYFLLRSEAPRLPRICTKIFHAGKIKDLFRCCGSYVGVDTSVETNTGFHEAHKSGKQFICNDIPALAKAHMYVNPRLDPARAATYKTTLLGWFREKFFHHEDTLWITCWKPAGNIPNSAQACYKSTLIVPMTLEGNMLAPEFKDRFGIGTSPEKAIYGFLCFDHPAKNYFNENVDIQIGYIFADLLSLYLVEHLKFTDKSCTVGITRRLLEEQKET